MKTIGILTSGGDAPGMNAAIRAVVRSAIYYGCKVYGINRGYKGLIESDLVEMDLSSVGDIIHRGGTILKSSRCEEFKTEEGRQKAVKILKKHGIDCLVVIGGDGSFNGAQKLSDLGFPAIGIPGTIDNDLAYTDYTIGFDTALNTIVDALDKLRDTSSSHQRCTILEVMGRRCGDLAVHAGLACGAEMIVTSESGFDEKEIIETLKRSKASDKKHALIVITEHITDVHELAKRVEEETGFETRANVLGHMQRGGSPTARDRVLASRMGIKAVELLEEGKGGLCVSDVRGEIVGLPIEEVLGHKRTVNQGIYEDVLKLR